MTPRIPDEELEHTIEIWRKNGKNQTHTAAELNISRGTLQHRLKLAAQRGLLVNEPPAMPGYRITRLSTQEDADGEVLKRYIQQKPEPGDEFEIPPGHIIKGESALVDPSGRVIQKWVKTKIGELDPIQLGENLKKLFEGYEPCANPILMPKAIFEEDLLTLLPCNDWHIGLYAWGKETEANWDLALAEKVIGEAVVDTLNRTVPSGTCVVLVGGDLLHADNSENKTAKSGNVLQVDGRYQKVMGVATRMLVKTVESALYRHKKVVVRVLPGNHDEHSAVAVAYFMAAWFRNEPRVTVDLDPSLFWWYRFGNVLLGATHGHTVKATKMPEIMAHRRAKDWGETRHRFVHCFHVHHKERLATEGAGVVTEIHQAPVPQDAWHFGAGFLSGRSIKAITYHRQFGWRGDVNTPIMDG